MDFDSITKDIKSSDQNHILSLDDALCRNEESEQHESLDECIAKVAQLGVNEN